MKVQELLELQQVITKRATPSDIKDNNLEDHYSTSKGEYIDILDMDLIHLIRSYNKHLGMGRVSDVKRLRDTLDTMQHEINIAREIVDKS